LTANIWWGTTFPPPFIPPNIAAVPCQLSPGEFIFAPNGVVGVYLKLPKLTDIFFARMFPFAGQDLVEVPAGSARWYNVLHVDDVGKGFPNEYRFALIAMIPPYTIPLP
jgi:hypothetical protein